MADVDNDPFGEHESRPEEPTDKHIPLTPVGGRSTWELECEQETSFGERESQRTKLIKDHVKDLYKKISENIDETPELFHYDYFKLEGGELYYIDNRKPLMTEGNLKSVGMLADILGKNRLCRFGFNIPVGHITAQQVLMLNKAAEELPSESDITGADDIYVSKAHKDILSPTNRWLVPNAYLRIFGKKFMKNIGFDVDKPKSGTKSKIAGKEIAGNFRKSIRHNFSD